MSFIDRIKHFVCSLSIILCNGLNSAAMETPKKPITYHEYFTFGKGTNPPIDDDQATDTSRKFSFEKLDDTLKNCKSTDYAVIYRSSDLGEDSWKAPNKCSMCGGDFKNDNFHAHSAKVKYSCTENLSKEPQAVDCIFLPIPNNNNMRINCNKDLTDWLFNSKNHLCFHCMEEYLEYYLKDHLKRFSSSDEGKKILGYIYYEILKSENNNDKSVDCLIYERFYKYARYLLPIEHRISNVNICFCNKIVELSPLSSIVMCKDGHWCHRKCFHFAFEQYNRTNCPWPCGQPFATVVPYFNVVEIIKEIIKEQHGAKKLDFNSLI